VRDVPLHGGAPRRRAGGLAHLPDHGPVSRLPQQPLHGRRRDGCGRQLRPCHVEPASGTRFATHTRLAQTHGSAGILSTCTASSAEPGEQSVAGAQYVSGLNCVSCHGGILCLTPTPGCTHGAVARRRPAELCPVSRHEDVLRRLPPRVPSASGRLGVQPSASRALGRRHVHELSQDRELQRLPRGSSAGLAAGPPTPDRPEHAKRDVT
jgi:hypothetical protein